MKIIYIILGFISLALGTVGIALPILPTTPFLLLSAICFAKGSKRLDRWFKGTKIYKNHLEDFVNNREMKMNTKISILAFATILLLIAFFAMENIYGRTFIAFLIAFKYYYFIFKVKTLKV
ncbi:YbaN family protein [Peptacetobacter sp.]|uniref:YbaN family protein n=1 Tax=Peptacetobacter sp. TaxID=2991975 RepID=UPI0026302DEC|nr:YbaN family protein [Peptacetobacter sp.]